MKMVNIKIIFISILLPCISFAQYAEDRWEVKDSRKLVDRQELIQGDLSRSSITMTSVEISVHRNDRSSELSVSGIDGTQSRVLLTKATTKDLILSDGITTEESSRVLISEVGKLDDKVVDYVTTEEVSRDLLVNEDRNARDRYWFSSDNRFIDNSRLMDMMTTNSIKSSIGYDTRFTTDVFTKIISSNSKITSVVDERFESGKLSELIKFNLDSSNYVTKFLGYSGLTSVVTLQEKIDLIWRNFYKEMPDFYDLRLQIQGATATYPYMLLKEIDNSPSNIELLKNNLNELKLLFQ